jgi:hypothetical protein
MTLKVKWSQIPATRRHIYVGVLILVSVLAGNVVKESEAMLPFHATAANSEMIDQVLSIQHSTPLSHQQAAVTHGKMRN